MALLFVVAWGAGCAGSRPTEPPPEQRFGHRFEPGTAEAGAAIVITPPDSAANYFYYPAPVDTLHVRPAPFRADVPAAAQQVPVELLVKGAFPDGCMEMHEARQIRSGNIINVDLQMRRPRGAVCAGVARPYRLYLLLEGRYGVGAYTLKLNGEPFTFQIRVPV